MMTPSLEIEKLLSSIEKYISEQEILLEDIDKTKRESYSLLCAYLKLPLEDGEDPVKKIQDERNSDKEKIEILRGEIGKLDETKEDWKTKCFNAKRELRQIEELKDDPILSIDNHSKNNFKVLSKILKVTYKTDQDSQATAALFRNVNRQIRFDDLSHSKQQKMNEYWKLLEYIDRKEL